MDEDFKKRSEDFVKEYGELVQKHQVDFIQYPMFVPKKDDEKRSVFEVVLQNQPIDLKQVAVKSPFVTQ